jgi:hypothetical protein
MKILIICFLFLGLAFALSASAVTGPIMPAPTKSITAKVYYPLYDPSVDSSANLVPATIYVYRWDNTTKIHWVFYQKKETSTGTTVLKLKPYKQYRAVAYYGLYSAGTMMKSRTYPITFTVNGPEAPADGLEPADTAIFPLEDM